MTSQSALEWLEKQRKAEEEKMQKLESKMNGDFEAHTTVFPATTTAIATAAATKRDTPFGKDIAGLKEQAALARARAKNSKENLKGMISELEETFVQLEKNSAHSIQVHRERIGAGQGGLFTKTPSTAPSPHPGHQYDLHVNAKGDIYDANSQMSSDEMALRIGESVVR